MLKLSKLLYTLEEDEEIIIYEGKEMVYNGCVGSVPFIVFHQTYIVKMEYSTIINGYIVTTKF